MTNTAYRDFNGLLPTILAEAQETMRANALFAPNGIGEKWLQLRSLEGAPGKTMDFPLWSKVASKTLLQPPTVGTTATEKIAMTTVTDAALERDVQGVAKEAGRELGLAMGSKFDVDVMALFSRPGKTVGDSGVDCSYQNILDAINALSEVSTPTPYLCVLHPQQWYDLLTEPASPLTACTGYGRMAEEVGYNYFVAQLYGIKTVVHPSVPLVNGDANRRGAILSERAIGFLWKWRPRLAYERDEGLRAFEVVLTTCYATDLLDPNMGVAIETDA